MKRIQTLGGLAVFDGARPLGGSVQQPRRLAILAVLARMGARGVNRDRLVALLWPDGEEERSRRSLNQALYALRQDLGSEEAVLGTRELRLNSGLVETDVGEFEAAAASGALEESARLYGGPFLGDFTLPGAHDFARWAEAERDALHGDYRRILESVATAAAGRGDWGGAVRWWRRLAALDPHDAQVAQGLMRCLAAAGDIPGAVRHAEIFSTLRQQQLELPPDPDVVALAERIRQGQLPPAPQRSSPQPSPSAAPPSPAADSHLPAAGTAGTGPAPAVLSIAVLPFINMSPDRENEYFSDGLTEELTEALTHVSGLRVSARTSAFSFKGKEVDAREIGSRLSVSLLVEGSVRKIGNRIRVTAQMIDVADGYHLWSDCYDRTLTDVFALQAEVAHSIVAALSLRAPGIQGTPRIRQSTDIPEAYTLYLRGRYFAQKRDPESLRVALEYFEQAIELDPGYALAHAGAGEAWALRGFEEFGDLPPSEAMPRALSAVNRALELDPELAEAHLYRGVIALLYEYDPAEAAVRLTRALALAPLQPYAHIWYGLLLSCSGAFEEAIAQMLEAERLDPVGVGTQWVLGRGLYFAGRFEESLQRFNVVMELNPHTLAAAWAARAYLKTGRAEIGLTTVESAIRRLGRQPALLEMLGNCLAELSHGDEARRVIGELEELSRVRHVSALLAASIHGHLGEDDAAFRCLEEAARQRSGYLVFVRTWAGLDRVRDTPEYRELMQRVGLGALMPAV